MSLHSSRNVRVSLAIATPRSSSSSSKSGAATPWTYTTIVASHTPQTIKDLPLLPIVLQPLRKHETTGRAPPPLRRGEPVSQGLGLLVVLPGAIVALLSAAFATTFYLYLSIRRGHDIPSISHGFYVDERTGNGSPLLGLVASTVITNIIWLVGFPVLSSMAAYCVAGSWLSYQQHPRSGRPNLLTPLQYGLLFKLFSAPGPRSVHQVGAYIANGRGRVPAPTFFSMAFFLMVGVLGLTYLISAADLWLHTVSTVVLVSSGPFTSNETPSPLSTHPSTAPALRSYYPLAPALTYIILLYLHSLLATVLTLWTAALRSPRLRPHPADAEPEAPSTTTWPAPPIPTALRLTHLHLTDALAPIAARLSGRREAHPALGRLGPSLFVEDINTARVEVGVWARDGERRRWGDTRGDKVFGVYKKVLPYRGEIY
ncbi:hypothetical protein B0H16DRAFT_109096 [Mycena metata]|uniref:Uncharacterized protein n=1 Tax=Mycena metata TaxID=1033252 RepID=A0AAD7HIQ3_9AGAR|nr:hypothetical protein B0H16DRAFT_367525 [Mycena metata]KAJ7736812.1 hypothetical protein B0H16DRAFT_109096 [Mycena metata]